ncbi:MAG: LytTR family DNA-binding domain-containing protein [Bacteroidia bacterium]|nr:LytTR family DNA-binding domain-containing protein [Bacteroidia bacterium]
MTKISCIIVDDEPLALNLLERYVRKTPFLEMVYRCSNAIEALEILNKQTIDLIFLDIQMPELSGIEFSRVIGKDAKIIFTTAFDEYAIEGFKVNALDYLLKPFNYEEFLRAANKAREWFQMVYSRQKTQEDNHNYIFVKSEYKQIKIQLNEVLYFEGLKDYIKIWLKDNTRPILTLMSLKSLEKKLPPDKFMRIHRSFIVALDKIQSVERSQIIIKNNVRITIADQYKEKFQDFITGKSII